MPKIERGGEQKKTWKLFTLAVVFAILAGLATMVYLRLLEHRLEEKMAPKEKATVQAVVAARDLEAGAKVSTATMAVRRVPAEYVNSDVITADRFDSVAGAILNKPLQQGKMLSSDYFDLAIPEDFSGTIKIGHRAVTIQVGEINSISGLIRPGNFVDIAARLQGGAVAELTASESGEVVIPVLEDVLVLATDQRPARPNEDAFQLEQAVTRRQSYDTLTLEVTPRQAALLSVAEARGSLVATLRNAKDTAGIRYSKIGLGDLVDNADKLLKQALSKQHNKGLSGVHVDDQGHLVTKDGVRITDPNVHLNKDGLLVDKNGTVLNGRNLVVGQDGKIRTQDGKEVDTGSLVKGKNGTLVDKNGNVVESNGYTSAKGGFLVDKDGNVYTHDGVKLSGLKVGKDGKVRTADGKVVTAKDLSVGKDGKVYTTSGPGEAMTVDKDGNLVDGDGKPVKARDLVTVDKDGVVRTKDGKVLKGVHVGKDGALYTADGRKMNAKDVMLAEKGLHRDKDGNIVDSSGHKVKAKDLVSVGKDGKVRTKDGTVLDGAYVDSDGVLRAKDGSAMSPADVAAHSLAAKSSGKQLLAGVSGSRVPGFAGTLGQAVDQGPGGVSQREVEYIVGGGSSDGVARTFMVRVESSAATATAEQAEQE